MRFHVIASDSKNRAAISKRSFGTFSTDPEAGIHLANGFLPQVFHLKFDKAYITDLNSINQHIYNKLLVRCFVFHVLRKTCSVFIFWRIFPFFSDEVAVLRASKDKLENFGQNLQ